MLLVRWGYQLLNKNGSGVGTAADRQTDRQNIYFQNSISNTI